MTLAPHGMRIVEAIDWTKGELRKQDVCRWEAAAGFRDGALSSKAVWHMASWDTITDCLRYGFTIDFDARHDAPGIMVSANKQPTNRKA